MLCVQRPVNWSVSQRCHWFEYENSPAAVLVANSKMQRKLFWFKGFRGSHSPLLIKKLFPVESKECNSEVTKS